MAIIRRVQNWTDQYTAVPNHWARDKSLSLKARGLLLELLSHQVGWSTTIESLRSEKDGRAAVKSAVDELVEAGWLVVEPVRDDGGLFVGSDWILVEPCRSEPGCDFPTADNPTADNRPHKKNIPIENQKKELSPTPDGFDAWWKLYPRKINKGGARRSFQAAAAKVSFDELLSATEAFAAEWSDRRDEIQFCPYASTWLNQERWSDYVVDRSERIMECERLVAEGRALELERVLGVRVPVPNFEGSAFEVQPRIKSWLADWWASDGKKLVG